MNPQIIRNSRRMSKILLANSGADFGMDDECEKSRKKEATNNLASLISSLNFGSEDMPIEEYVQLVGEEIVDVEYTTAELWIWHGTDKSIWV